MQSCRGELFDIMDKESLVRLEFNKEINLNDYDLNSFRIPKSFKDFSFYPKNGLDLTKIMDLLENDLYKKGIRSNYIQETTAGVCEAIKNAYEHGNLKSEDKKILIGRHFSKKKAEYVIGDEGGMIDGNFFPYILSLKESKKDGKLEFSPNFYSFCGKGYAPLGHSGVGTRTMNTYLDDILYYRNESGGLSVYMSKNIPDLN